MIDVRQLRTLRALADHGTVVAAAESLYLTPSAVSQQLAVLSKSIGCELLERRGRNVVLTEAARVLVAHADAIFAQLERAQSDLRAMSPAPNAVRITGFPTAVMAVVAPAMKALREKHPEWGFEIADTESEESVARLIDGSVDVAVVMAAPNRPLLGDPRIKVMPLLEEVYVAALPEGHPFAEAATVSLTDLVEEPFVLAAEGLSCHDQVTAICADAGFQPRGRYRATDFSAALALIANGFGVTLLPTLGVPARVPDGVVLVPLKEDWPRRVSLIAMRAGAEHAEVVEALREAAGRLVG
jgi:DNA-binding transcriptional LysR family regulator